MLTEGELGDMAARQLDTVSSELERAITLSDQGRDKEASATLLGAYALASAAHAILEVTEADRYSAAFDEAERLRTELHELLLERLGVEVVSAEEIGKAQARKRMRSRLEVISGGKDRNRKRNLLRMRPGSD